MRPCDAQGDPGRPPTRHGDRAVCARVPDRRTRAARLLLRRGGARDRDISITYISIDGYHALYNVCTQHGLSICLSIHLSNNLSIYLSIQSIYLSFSIEAALAQLRHFDGVMPLAAMAMQCNWGSIHT